MQATYSPREADLQIAARIANKIDTHKEDRFILTGSYSIDLLTGSEVKHNDIDANIFTNNIQRSIARVALLLKADDNLMPILDTNNRLEFSYTDRARASKLELQFIEYANAIENHNGTDFILPKNGTDHEIIVPTIIQKTRINSITEETYEFSIKSLPYAIATWALRVSGVALSQKRQVRQTDIDHFVYLINTPHDDEAIKDAIRHHPQMPRGADVDNIINIASNYVEKVTSHD